MTGRPGFDAVSVVIPTWNSARYLAEAIASALAQTFPPAEVVVVDDGSQDDSVSVAASFGPIVRVVPQAHAGQGRARNHGAEVARGPWLAFLDADDVWLPNKLADQRAVLDHHPGAEIVFGRVEQFYSPDLGRTDEPPSLAGAEAAGLLPSSLCCTREAFFRYGGFTEGVSMGEMVGWYARALDEGAAIATVDQVVVRRRIHSSNTGITHRDQRQLFNTQLKAMLDRRRAASRTDQPR